MILLSLAPFVVFSPLFLCSSITNAGKFYEFIKNDHGQSREAGRHCGNKARRWLLEQMEVGGAAVGAGGMGGGLVLWRGGVCVAVLLNFNEHRGEFHLYFLSLLLLSSSTSSSLALSLSVVSPSSPGRGTSPTLVAVTEMSFRGPSFGLGSVVG